MLTVKNGSIQPGSFHLLGIAPETQYGGLTVGITRARSDSGARRVHASVGRHVCVTQLTVAV